MCSLDLFRSPQLLNQRTLREYNGFLDEGNDECVLIDEAEIYPTIEVKEENIIKPSITDESVDNIFMRKDVTLWKQFIRCLQYKGFTSALKLIRDYDNEEHIQSSLFLQFSRKLSQFVLYLWHLLLEFYVFLYPFVLKSNEELCNEFNKSMNWKNGLIRAFEWHPNHIKCAVCLINDCIYIYSSDNSLVPLLKHSLQTRVTALSWNPERSDVLAVSCESVVLIWTIDPNSRQYRLSNDCIQVISSGIPSPLTDLKFSPNGNCVSACSPQSSKLILINTESDSKEVKTVRHFGNCFTKLLWSPDGSRLFCGTTSKHIRVFESKSWSSKKWSQHFDDICQTSCWSRPDGRILLVAPRDSFSVFAIPFYDSPQPKDVGGSQVLFQVLDVSEHQFPNGVKVGGNIHEMVWDKNSERLALSFKDNKQYIALYKTVIRPKLEVTPIGFIRGFNCEVPLLMSFHDRFTRGSLLTVCWDSGIVSNIPLEFDSKVNQSMYRTGTPRSLTSFCAFSPNLNNSLNPMSTPIRKTPLRESNANIRPQIHFHPNDSVLSPKRPLLFTTLSKNNSNFE